MNRTFRNRGAWIGLCLAFFLPFQAFADELSPMNIQGRYTLTWNGITIGKLQMEATEEGRRYHAQALLAYSGLAKLFGSHESTTEVEGMRSRPEAPFETATRIYATSYDNGSKDARIKLAYGAGGALEEQTIEPPENWEARPRVSLESAAGVSDPLTMLYVLRREVHEARAKNRSEGSIKMFDGKRLTELVFSIGEDSHGIELAKDRFVVVLPVVVTRKAIDGYKPKELKRLKKEADAPIKIYFSDDANFIPILIQTRAPLGLLRATLKDYNAL